MNALIKQIKEQKVAKNKVCAWYLGQEGFLFKFLDKYLVIDPYLSDYVDRNCSQLVKWKRLYPAPISGKDLDFVDYVVCTHSHYDHADPTTISQIAKVNKKAKFIVPSPIKNVITSYGVCEDNIISAKADQIIDLGDISITPIPSAHEEFHQDNNGDYFELGYILNFGKTRIFHAGDMCMYDGLIERLVDIDLGLLPINGRDYFRNKLDIIGNFNCEEVVLLAKEAKIKKVIPIHHDLYAVNSESPERFIEQVKKLNKKQKYQFLKVSDNIII